MIWIEYEDGSARWADATEEQVDKILAYAEIVMERKADTTT